MAGCGGVKHLSIRRNNASPQRSQMSSLRISGRPSNAKARKDHEAVRGSEGQLQSAREGPHRGLRTGEQRLQLTHICTTVAEPQVAHKRRGCSPQQGARPHLPGASDGSPARCLQAARAVGANPPSLPTTQHLRQHVVRAQQEWELKGTKSQRLSSRFIWEKCDGETFLRALSLHDAALDAAQDISR